MPDDPSVLDVLRERARTRSKREKRDDKYHVALVIECGGMRGVAAGGAAKVLADTKYLDGFDTLHGSSSGACVAAYLLAGQAEEGQKIYLEDICDRRVVNPYRFLNRPCMVDTDHIAFEVIGERRALNSKKIIDAPGVLNVVVSEVQSGSPRVLDTFTSLDGILLALKTTLCVPGPFEPGVRMGTESYLDGGIVAPIPFFSALKKGATHILVIGTQRQSDYYRRNNLLELERIFLRLRYGRSLSENYRKAHSRPAIKTPEGMSGTVKLDVITRGDDSAYCAWHTIDKQVLLKVQNEAAAEAERYFSG